MNDEKPNIYQRILAVMGALDYVQKGDKEVSGQYKYVSHDAVSAALHPLLVEHGIAAIPTVKNWAQNGNRTEMLITVKFVNVDRPEDYFEIDALGFGVDSQDKGPGKAISYAFKMAVLKTFVLETGEDPERASIDHVPANDDELAKAAANLARVALANGDWVTLCKMASEEQFKNAARLLDSKERKAIKQLQDKRSVYRDALNDAADTDDVDSAIQLRDELDDNERRCVWPVLKDSTRTYLGKLKDL